MNMAIRVQLESFFDTHTFADMWNIYVKGREGGEGGWDGGWKEKGMYTVCMQTLCLHW